VEGGVDGSSKTCGTFKCTYYCSVNSQKAHWKEGGHKQHCVAVERRRDGLDLLRGRR